MKWRWLVGAGVALSVILLIQSVSKPNQPKLHEIRWQADIPIGYILPCDLDGDGRDEVVVETRSGEYWWLKPSLSGWKATLMPVKKIASTYYFTTSLHHGILVRDASNALCFLFYRNGWQLQKLLDAPLQDFKWLDLDGDGKVNDVLVLKGRFVWWFKIGGDGQVIVQDRKRIPGRRSSPSPLKFGFGFWSEKGKLVISSDWVRLEVPQLDWDGDGIPEIVHYNKSSGDNKLLVHFSRTRENRRIFLANSPLKLNYMHGEFMVTVDLKGKGKRELATVAWTGRIILVDEQGRWRPTPCKPGYDARRLWVTRRGKKDWLWATTPEKLWLLHHDEKDCQVRQWKVRGYPLVVWQDKQGIWFAFYSKWSLAQHPAGRWATKVSNWFRSLGIPLNISSLVRREKIWLHFWKWDESRNDWQQVKRIRIPTRLNHPLNHPFLYADMRLVDLNGDGQNEWIVVTDMNSLSSALMLIESWLFAGQWHFVGKSWQVPILRDGQRKWVVSIDDKDRKVLRGLTLTDVDVKSSDGR